MTTEEFKQAQSDLGRTNQSMADLLCCSLSHLEALRRGYKTGKGEKIAVLPTEKDVTIIQQALEIKRLNSEGKPNETKRRKFS